MCRRERLLRFATLVSVTRAQGTGCDPGVSVTHALFTPQSTDPAALLQQEFREIPVTATQMARVSALPFEPPARVDAAYLQWEHAETNGFPDKALRKDPRLKPSDVHVTKGHMLKCMMCEHEAGVRENVHPNSSTRIHIGAGERQATLRLQPNTPPMCHARLPHPCRRRCGSNPTLPRICHTRLPHLLQATLRLQPSTASHVPRSPAHPCHICRALS